ncbi:MAG: hypothetical protein FWE50_03035 [Alphaproteobacteria bacterium]|nr:hypothetical protein [Alphaproteobacteria bacterium]
MKNKFVFFTIILCALCFVFSAPQAVQVSKTADTAAAAKSMALSSARRDAFEAIVGEKIPISDKELVNLVESEVIENEKVSATSYTAEIFVEMNRTAVNNWLEKNNIQTIYRAPVVSTDRAAVIFESVGGLNKWTVIEQAARTSGADLRISSISDGKISATMRANAQSAFVAAIRSNGINVSDYNGILTVR